MSNPDSTSSHLTDPPDPTDPTAPADPLSGLSYEAARAELEQVVRQLEAGGTSLEDSLQLWERGTALAEVCQARLDGARARLASADPGQGPQD
jgi:exodeoxyribonuclease VII small subunit